MSTHEQTQISLLRAKTEDEIERLEAALGSARACLALQLSASDSDTKNHHNKASISTQSDENTTTGHHLLLLADSALPLGSFAFSSGLESYLAHHQPRPPFEPFLALSIQSLASTALPYVIAAYQTPTSLETLDNDFDASTPCTVARRASIAQGRALLALWERSLRRSDSDVFEISDNTDQGDRSRISAAKGALLDFSRAMKGLSTLVLVNGHFPPLWAIVCSCQGVSLKNTSYVFLLNHAKAVVSAAVRASVLGPYAAQALLASKWLRYIMNDALAKNEYKGADEAGQCAPVLDLWFGRHELLYSRIFNS